MIVILYGGCWSVPEVKYRWLLEAIANCKDFKMEDYGELLDRKHPVVDISLMTPEDAMKLIEEI